MLAILLQAWPDNGRGSEAGGAGGKMDDIAAREVLHAQRGKPPATP